MKKILSCIALLLCVVLGTVFLPACGKGTAWLRPNFAFDVSGVTVRFLDNTVEDFDFPIEGRKLDHSNYEREGIIEYVWVIYNGDDIVGWIEAGNGYDSGNKNGSYNYGYSTSNVNEVYGYHNTHFFMVLKSDDLTVFDRLTVLPDYGSAEIAKGEGTNPVKAGEIYVIYDEQTNQSRPAVGAENFVCCSYNVILENIEAPGLESISITFAFKSE